MLGTDATLSDGLASSHSLHFDSNTCIHLFTRDSHEPVNSIGAHRQQPHWCRCVLAVLYKRMQPPPHPQRLHGIMAEQIVAAIGIGFSFRSFYFFTLLAFVSVYCLTFLISFLPTLPGSRCCLCVLHCIVWLVSRSQSTNEGIPRSDFHNAI